MREKKCSKCKIIKSVEDFRKHKNTKDGFQHQCKSCQSAYYHNSPNYQKVAKEGAANRRKLAKDFVTEWKLKGCIYCGYNKCADAIDCHHTGNKESDIGLMKRKGMSLIRIKQELEKCIPLCCRCHREYHVGLITL